MNIIETHNLTKTYGSFTAVHRLNLHIKKGTVYGFLGPNGAGKSTTMKMFLGLTRPTAGGWATVSKRPDDNSQKCGIADRGTCLLREFKRPGKSGNYPADPEASKKFRRRRPGAYRPDPVFQPSGKKIFPGHEAAPRSCRRPLGKTAPSHSG